MEFSQTDTTLVTDDRRSSRLGHIPERRKASDRRKEVRTASRSRPATLCVADRLPFEIQIRDVSRSGMGLTTPEAMLVGTEVVVVCGGLTIDATVRHCHEYAPGEYSTGISIDRIINTEDGREI